MYQISRTDRFLTIISDSQKSVWINEGIAN